jgi:hypothetical protein
LSRFPVAFRPPAFASRSSDSRRGVGPSLRSAYRTRPRARRTSTGLPRSTRTSCDRGGCPLCPRDGGTHPGLRRVLSRRLPLYHGESLYPAPASHLAGLRITRHQTRVHVIHPSGLPLACGTRMERAAAWAFPRASNPADQEPDDARRGGDRPTSTDLELPAQHHIRLILQSGSSLVSCDFASQRALRDCRACSPGVTPSRVQPSQHAETAATPRRGSPEGHDP